MTETNGVYLTETSKAFYKDGIKLGSKLWLGVGDNIENYTETDEPIIDELYSIKKEKREEISKNCNDTIINGIDYNNEHYSLTENDQINLTSLYNMSLQTPAHSLLYHADGELCRIFTADEIQAIMSTATQHKTYQTTYCNHMFAWIDRLTSSDDVNAITYGDTLPDDLLSHLQEVLGIEQDS